MAKITAPLLSISATGSINNILNYQSPAGKNIVRVYKKTNKIRSPKQKTVNERYSKCVKDWLNLDQTSIAEYKKKASLLNLNGMNVFISENMNKTINNQSIRWDNNQSMWDGGQTVWPN
jgi:hypothetical protein